MKSSGRRRITQWGTAVIIFIALSSVNVLIFRVLRENNILVSRNNGERSINDLMALLRDTRAKGFEDVKQIYEAYGSAILGLGAYNEQGNAFFAWGTAPESMRIPGNADGDWKPREYTPNRERESLIILQHAPPRRRDLSRPPGEKGDLLSYFLRSAAFYWEVHQPDYWRLLRFYQVLFPVTEAILGAVIVFITLILKKNREYRSRIEEQNNLVVLGTAAGTLAHEIKNPLSAIKLQTGIIERTLGPGAQREITIINEEIDRLSMLARHVNDYLRNPGGNPELFDAVEAVRNSTTRVLGRTIVFQKRAGPVRIRFDRERFRSVLENVLLNALQSGGKDTDIEIHISRKDGRIRIEVLDRGTGIPAEAAERIFDPFFTTKSSGTGVGLPVVKRFLEAAGGTFSITNRNGGGAAAVIDIPEIRE